jgi:hypothetical protein
MNIERLFWNIAISIVLGCFLSLSLATASDIVLGPIVGTQNDGRLYSLKLISMDAGRFLHFFATSLASSRSAPLETIGFVFGSEHLYAKIVVRWFGLLATGLASAFVWVFLFSDGTKKPRHVEGIRLLSGKTAVRDANAKYESERRSERVRDLPIIELAPQVRLTPNQETRGIFIEGGIGSGKTVIIKYLLNQAIERGDKIVLYDVKGDFAPAIKHRLLLNPFAEGSSAWSIALDVQTVDQARQLSKMLVPDANGSGDSFWTRAAQSILTGIFASLQAELPKRWTFADVRERLLMPREGLVALFAKHYPIAGKFISDKPGGSNIEQGVVATLAAQIDGFIEPLALAWNNGTSGNSGISLADWLASKNSPPEVLVLQGSPENSEATAAWIRMVVNHLAGLLLSPEVPNDSSRRIWIFVDELPSLGPIPRLMEIVDRGRQKGVRTVVAVQNLAQIEQHYGEWAKSAESTFGTRIVGKMSPGERTASISKSLGMKYVEDTSVTTTRDEDRNARSERLAVSARPALSPEIFGSLGVQGSAGIDALVLGLTENVLRLHWPFQREQRIYHPPSRPARFDRTILGAKTIDETPPATNKAIAKKIGLKLGEAISDFDSNNSGRPSDGS